MTCTCTYMYMHMHMCMHMHMHMRTCACACACISRYVAAGVNPENLPFRNFERRELMSRFNLSLSLLEARAS
jgi:hypothetical protein